VKVLSHEFREVTRGPWITAGRDVQFKLIGRTLYVECSDGKSDWRYNLAFGKKTYDGGDVKFRAHRGFRKLWLSIKDEIEKLDFEIVVCYSQGAGIGVFIHENFYHRKGYEPTTYAFGAPRVVWMPSKELRTRFAQFYRIKNKEDIVTRVPPAILGYKHVGQEIILDRKVKRPKGCNIFRWLSGHAPEMYNLRLEGL
jgi:hypothetical protein